MTETPVKIPVRWLVINLLGALLAALGISLLQAETQLKWIGYGVLIAGILLAGFALLQILRRAHR